MRSLLDTRSCSLLVLLLELGDLEGGGLGELEVDGVGRQLLVGVGKGIKTGLHHFTVHWVEEDLLDLAAISANADLAASAVGWGDNIVEDCLVDGLEGAGAWSLLGWVSHGVWGDDSPVGNNNNWLSELTL